MILLLLAGCPKPTAPEPPALVEPAPAAPVAPRAGQVEGGVFTDAVHGTTVRLLPDAVATVGAVDDPLRLVVEDPVSGLRFELWAWPDGGLDPRPRAGCAWTFDDVARYRALKVTDPVRVSTCTPHEAGGARVMGTFIARGGVGWHLLAVLPYGRTAAARARADEMLGTVRFGQRDL